MKSNNFIIKIFIYEGDIIMKIIMKVMQQWDSDFLIQQAMYLLFPNQMSLFS